MIENQRVGTGVYLSYRLYSLQYIFCLSVAFLRPQPNVRGRVVGLTGAQPETRVSTLCSCFARGSPEAEAGAGTPRISRPFSRPVCFRFIYRATIKNSTPEMPLICSMPAGWEMSF